MSKTNEVQGPVYKAEVTIKSRIDKIVDPYSSRYALGHIQATPAGEGRVFLTATDGRKAVVLPTEGHVDQERLIPGELLLKKKVGRKPHKVTLNGRWESSDDKFAAEPEGRFPRVDDCFANREHFPQDVGDVNKDWAGGSFQLSLDPRMLADMAEALNDSQRSLTLFLRADKSGVVSHSINVLGENGVGVLMPCSVDKSEGKRFDEIVEDYRKAKGRSKSGSFSESAPVKSDPEPAQQTEEAIAA